MANEQTETQRFLRGFNTIMLSIITASLIWFAKSSVETRENVNIIYNDIQYLKKDIQILQNKMDANYSKEQIDLKLYYIQEDINYIKKEIKEIKR